MKKPKQIYYSMKDYRKKLLAGLPERDENFFYQHSLWPCVRCAGRGRLSVRMCPICEGKKYIDEDTFRKEYEKVDDYDRKLKEYNEIKEKVDKILDKLSEEDVALLKRWFR